MQAWKIHEESLWINNVSCSCLKVNRLCAQSVPYRQKVSKILTSSSCENSRPSARLVSIKSFLNTNRTSLGSQALQAFSTDTFSRFNYWRYFAIRISERSEVWLNLMHPLFTKPSIRSKQVISISLGRRLSFVSFLSSVSYIWTFFSGQAKPFQSILNSF